ncbi:hypothetical protein JCM19045_567 [Bacillus sp. JCM 19045]|nr:hypothetical protein JCM19045_567 [Bacillus sp. JCM 19045]
MKLYQKMALIVAGIGLVGCGTPNAETNESLQHLAHLRLNKSILKRNQIKNRR